jgi:hypothetical protein
MMEWEESWKKYIKYCTFGKVEIAKKTLQINKNETSFFLLLQLNTHYSLDVDVDVESQVQVFELFRIEI